MDTSVVIAILSLALTIGGAIAMFGRFQGKVTEKTEQNSKDIDGLWSHQRKQDNRYSIDSKNTAEIIATLTATSKSIKETTDEIKLDVKDIRKEIYSIRGEK